MDLGFDLRPAQVEGIEGLELTSPMAVHLHVTKTGRNILLEGGIACQVSLVCSRCLKIYPDAWDLPFKMTLCPHPGREMEGERELNLDDMEVTFYRGEEIDLGAVVREELILALPFRPLCHEGCKGLCAGCGADLNLEPCRCASAGIDPRLAPLKNLLKQ